MLPACVLSIHSENWRDNLNQGHQDSLLRPIKAIWLMLFPNGLYLSSEEGNHDNLYGLL